MNPDGSSRRWRYALLGLGSLAYTCLMFVWFSVPAYLPAVTANLGLSSTEAGLLTGAVPLTYVPVSLASGLITDRVGASRAIGAGLTLFGLAQVGRAGAGTFTAMLALTVLVGVGGTAITFGLPKLVAELFPAEAAGTPSSVYMLGSFAGTSAAFGLGRTTLGPALGGWRPLLFWSGAVVVAYAALWWAVVAIAPASARAGRDSGNDDGGSGGLASLRREARVVLANPSMRLLVVVGVVYLMTTHGVQNWLATVLAARGAPAALAATVAGAFVLAQATGTFLVPPLSDRLGTRGRVIAGCGGLCVVGVGALATPGLPIAVGAAGALLAGVGVGGVSPLVRTVPAELDGVGPARTGAAVGMVFAVGEMGGFLGPFLVGSLFGVTGSYGPGLAVVCVAGLLAVEAGRRLPV